MRTWDNVAIIGVGLIGGSIGLALRQRKLAKQVVGIGRRVESLAEARRVGAVTQTTTDLAQGVARAELIVVCTPVASIAEHVRQAASSGPRGTLITDAGSTKAQIVEQLDRNLPGEARFVGSHPLAGSERSGPGEARADLLVGRVVVITPTRRSRSTDVEALTEFWISLGASVVSMSPTKHDRALAATSHLPHLIAAALAGTLVAKQAGLAAGGLRDTTRVASGDAELWTQILLDNRDNVLAALASFDKSLQAFRTALERGDRSRLHKVLTQAKRKRDALGS